MSDRPVDVVQRTPLCVQPNERKSHGVQNCSLWFEAGASRLGAPAGCSLHSGGDWAPVFNMGKGGNGAIAVPKQCP